MEFLLKYLSCNNEDYKYSIVAYQEILEEYGLEIGSTQLIFEGSPFSLICNKIIEQNNSFLLKYTIKRMGIIGDYSKIIKKASSGGLFIFIRYVLERWDKFSKYHTGSREGIISEAIMGSIIGSNILIFDFIYDNFYSEIQKNNCDYLWATALPKSNLHFLANMDKKKVKKWDPHFSEQLLRNCCLHLNQDGVLYLLNKGIIIQDKRELYESLLVQVVYFLNNDNIAYDWMREKKVIIIIDYLTSFGCDFIGCEDLIFGTFKYNLFLMEWLEKIEFNFSQFQNDFIYHIFPEHRHYYLEHRKYIFDILRRSITFDERKKKILCEIARNKIERFEKNIINNVKFPILIDNCPFYYRNQILNEYEAFKYILEYFYPYREIDDLENYDWVIRNEECPILQSEISENDKCIACRNCRQSFLTSSLFSWHKEQELKKIRKSCPICRKDDSLFYFIPN